MNEASSTNTRITAGAARMRISRQRRKEKMRCLTLEVLDAEIDRLVTLGYLGASARNDRNEVVQAFYRFLDTSPIGCRHR